MLRLKIVYKYLMAFILPLTFIFTANGSVVAYLYALEADLAALTAAGASLVRSEAAGDRTLRTYRLGAHTLIVAPMGSGQSESAVSATAILARRAVDAMVTTGVVGALDDQFAIGDVVLIESVLAWQAGSLRDGAWAETPRSRPELRLWNASSWTVPRVGVASGDVFVADDAERVRLRSTTGMPVIDMNLQGLQNAANAYSLPVLHLRVVSDRAGAEAPEEFRQFTRDYRGDLARRLVEWLSTLPPDTESPSQYPALRRLQPVDPQP